MEKNIDIPDLDKHENICEVLNKHNKQCYIVGGAVRDALLGREPHDIDFATDATPDEIKSIFTKHGCSAYPTGEQFGTITVSCDGINFYEITTFRGEHYKRHSRKPEVSFSNSIYEDLSRRDFTINAMAYDPLEHKLIDPFGGYEDLQNRIIRAVGNPIERFSEDPLRMLRMCRFMAYIDGEIDSDTLLAATEMKDNLEWISAERIRDELIKGITKGDPPSEFIQCIVNTRLNDYVIPELYDLIDLEQPSKYHAYDVYTHTLKALDAASTEEVKLAALLHDIGKPETMTEKNGRIMFTNHAEVSAEITKEIMSRLKFSNREISRISRLVRYHMAPIRKDVRDNPHLMMDLIGNLTDDGQEMDMIDKLKELSIADMIATGKDIDERLDEVEEFFSELNEVMKSRPISRKELAINGKDIVDEFGVKGKIVGDTLNYLLNKVWKNPELNNREELLLIAYNYIKSRGELKNNKVK